MAFTLPAPKTEIRNRVRVQTSDFHGFIITVVILESYNNDKL